MPPPLLVAPRSFPFSRTFHSLRHFRCMETLHWRSFATRGATRKASDTKKGRKDSSETPSQAKETAEIERGSWIRRKRNAHLQAPLWVTAVFVYPGAFYEVAHGAKRCCAHGVFWRWALWVRIDLVPWFCYALSISEGDQRKSFEHDLKSKIWRYGWPHGYARRIWGNLYHDLRYGRRWERVSTAKTHLCAIGRSLGDAVDERRAVALGEEAFWIEGQMSRSRYRHGVHIHLRWNC